MTGLVITGMSAVVWMTILVRLDPHRGQKGSNRRMMILFLLGALSAAPAYFLSTYIPAGDPGSGSLARSLVLFVCVYAPIEEFSKFLLFGLLVTKLRSLREPADGIFQAAAVGLGFAIVENVFYALSSSPQGALLRASITPLRHMIYSGIWGLVYATQRFGQLRLTAKGVLLVFLAIISASIVHGFSNFMVKVGFGAQMFFTSVMTLSSFLVLAQLKRISPYALRDLGRPREALRAIENALVHDPSNTHLHLRAAHFRLRCGDASRAAAHLECFLAARPDDSYATGLMGAALVLAGSRHCGAAALERAQTMMGAQTRRVFRRNLSRLLAPGRGRPAARPGFDESLLRTLLLLIRFRENGLKG